MTRNKKRRLALIVASFGLTLGLAGFASSGTGAFFSDSTNGGITGTVGAVHLSTSNTTFVWSNLMPGEPQSANVDFKNTGTGPQDFYLVFPNTTALSALNNLGTYGEVHVSVNGNEIFGSANLNDGYSCGTPGNPGVATLCPIPKQMMLLANVQANGLNSFKFQFNYASKLGSASHSSGGGVFNTYPVSGQNTVVASDGSGNGLPFQVVAVQVGQTP